MHHLVDVLVTVMVICTIWWTFWWLSWSYAPSGGRFGDFHGHMFWAIWQKELQWQYILRLQYRAVVPDCPDDDEIGLFWPAPTTTPYIRDLYYYVLMFLMLSPCTPSGHFEICRWTSKQFIFLDKCMWYRTKTLTHWSQHHSLYIRILHTVAPLTLT